MVTLEAQRRQGLPMEDALIPHGATLDLPGVPPTVWPVLLNASRPDRIALVGGAVRDWLLHHRHLDPWRGLVDLDLVIEDASVLGTPAGPVRQERSSPAWRLVDALSRSGGGVVVRAARPHGQYGTVELELEVPAESPGAARRPPIRLLLDVASARAEAYPVPAANPVVCFGALEDDLARRDLTINAMAIDLASGTLLDSHGGQCDLRARQLRFLHANSLRDDPTRLVRAARYAARLGFSLAPESQSQVTRTLDAWPWPWRAGDPPDRAPAALGTRLGRELVLLLEQDNWRLALGALQGWGGLSLLDASLQRDRHWERRLHWARRFALPPLVALIAAAGDPVALAERLRVPQRQGTLLSQLGELRGRLATGAILQDRAAASPWDWCQLLEAPGLSPEAVALALACGLAPRRPLLRWLLRWRQLGPELSARDLLASGMKPGPQVGERLRRSRKERLEAEPP